MVLADAPRRTREADVRAKPLFGIYLLASVYPRCPESHSTSMIHRTDESSSDRAPTEMRSKPAGGCLMRRNGGINPLKRPLVRESGSVMQARILDERPIAGSLMEGHQRQGGRVCCQCPSEHQLNSIKSRVSETCEFPVNSIA